MSDLTSRLANLSPEKRALLEKRLQQKADGAVTAGAEPIAIIGMACRFPGAATPEAFWDLIERGGDAIREVPPARWDNQAIYDADTSRPGTTNARKGGFLDDVELFDAPFFGISPREAARMDPQQRLFLEVAWEALEDAGQDVDALAGSDTGVFVGLHGHANDYFWFDVPHPERMDAFTGPGTSHNIVAGRLSYLYDLQGPAMVVDTACSSSLVAIHLACQSLRSTECSLALAGGVNLVLSPVFTIALSRLGMLSPDGHCRAFDAGANGFVRSEGCGVVTLKRLADARAAGDRVLAVIRGSAVNQDGRTNGITAPSSPSQQRVISRALANAGVSAGQISYVEAHGTGTELGDPIEVEALSAVVGASPQAQPCFLGSAKANVGHLEGAAGVAGVIKTVLALQHKTIPPLALFRTLNPHISLDGTRLSIPVAAQPWDADRRIAGVSSFGWSGTNAHVVIEEAPEHDAPVVRPSSAAVLPVSARSEGALRELAAAYASLLQSHPEDFHRISAAASRRRTHHDFRAAVAGASAADLISALNDYAAGKPTWNAAVDRAVAGRTVPIAFVFSGQGPQWAGMGQQLLAANDAFRDAVTQVSRLLEPLAGWSLLSELAAEPGRSRLQDTAVAQPALFALQVGLAAAFKAAGVEPGAVVGHSIGEVAAAHVSGALDLDEAVRVVFHRSRVMQQATGHGRMVAVELPASEVEQVIGRDAGLVSIASINAPRSCVISGEPATVEAITARLESSNIICRPLPVNYAFHSVQMDAPAAELRAALGTVRRQATQLPLVSTVTGEVIAGTALDADYWGRNVRGSVMFAKAMSTLQARGHQLFLELSPHPVLATSIRACGRGDSAPVAVASLQRGKDEPTAVMAAIGAIYTKGHAVNWRRVYDAAPPMTLPRYPFQRSWYWLPEGGASRAGLSASAPPSVEARNELSAPGRRVRSPQLTANIFECEWSSASPSWLADHRINGAVTVPAAAYLALLAAAGEQVLGASASLIDIFLHRPLRLDGNAPAVIQTILEPQPDGTYKAEIVSSNRAGAEWTVHVTAVACAGTIGAAPMPPLAAATTVGGDTHYAAIAERGALLGELFRTARQIAQGEQRAEVALAIHPQLVESASRYPIHPTLLDGALQAIIAALPADDPRRATGYLPQSFARVTLAPRAPQAASARAHLKPANAGDPRLTADLQIHDASGGVIASLEGVSFAPAAAASSGAEKLIYEEQWVPAGHAPARSAAGSWLVIGDRTGVADAIAARLRARGSYCVVAESAADLGHCLRANGVVDGIICTTLLDFSVPIDADAEAFGAAGSRVLELLKAAATIGVAAPTVFLITSGAQPAAAAVASPLQATVWGLSRIVSLEHPDLKCVCIDLDGVADVDALIQEITSTDDETEIALRGAQRFVRRLVRVPSQPLAAVTGAEALSLDTTRRGTLDHLTLRRHQRDAPGPDEIEIAVEASGVNFRDVLNALGVYQGAPGPFGSECAGIVTAVGANVTRLRPGARVMAVPDGAMATHVITPAHRAIEIPVAMPCDVAASLPIAFLTARYALDDVAALTPGERVLIHAAAGGVGLAAVQVAQQRGAEIYATAGSADKRRLLESLGVKHVFSSRDLSFAPQLLAATGGRGVDVALNSLAGEFIPQTLGILAQGGRFIELGKAGIWTSEQVHALRPDVSYAALYLGDIFISDPERTQRMLRDLCASFVEGTIRPLPISHFAFDRSAEAFRHMAQARHVGKIVLTHATIEQPTSRVREDATYLITGGLGSLGLSTAERLVQRGARHLVLAGRRMPNAEARARIAAMETSGTRIVIEQVDVAERPEVDGLLARVAASMPPLAGIVHAAGVLDDGVLMQQSWERFMRVMRPKVVGSWHLHDATRQLPLDFFVMFSAAATSLGSPGQSNYAAANAFMDALAHLRRAQKLPALSINWGPWSDGGMARTVSAETERRWREQGMRFISTSTALDAMAVAMSQDSCHLTIADIEWQKFVRGSARVHPAFRMLVAAPAIAGPGPDPDLLLALRDTAPVRRLALLTDHVHRQALSVLGLPASYPLDAQQGLRDVGLDSLMAVELRNRLQAGVNQSLPTTLAFDCPTVDALARHLAETLQLDLGTAAAPEDSRVQRAAEEIRDLTDEEAAAALNAEFAAFNAATGRS